MKAILRILRNTDQPIASYAWRAGLLALVPSLMISTVVVVALPGQSPELRMNAPAIVVVFGTLVLSPWTETILMWPVLWGLQRFIAGRTQVAVASAIFWGLLHSLAAPTWGIVIAWPFFVFSVCFLAWGEKSRKRAIVATALTHTFQNVLPTIGLLASG